MIRESEAVAAVASRLTQKEFPARVACQFSGQVQVRTWGVDLKIGTYIPIKSAYWMVLRELDPTYDKPTTAFNTAEAKRFFRKLEYTVKALPAAYWREHIPASDITVMSGIPAFQENHVYSLSYLNELFGGQEQRGIITPTIEPVVIAITAPDGKKHDYHDTWTDEGVFLYYGEGRNRDMKFEEGNKAIRDHVKNGKALLVFQKKGKDKYAFCGEFVCVGYTDELSKSPGRKGLVDIIFQLMRTSSLETLDEEMAAPALGNTKADLAALRQAAMKASGGPVRSQPKGARASAFRRAAEIVKYVNCRAEGKCEWCEKPAPFFRDDGTPFLESHHINRLTDGGLDHYAHVAAVCPNCHKEAHHSEGRRKLNAELADRIAAKEAELGKTLNPEIDV